MWISKRSKSLKYQLMSEEQSNPHYDVINVSLRSVVTVITVTFLHMANVFIGHQLQ